jgi:hypothetical protein
MGTSFRDLDNHNVEVIADRSGGAVIVDLEHHRIHRGQAFQFIAFPVLDGTTPAYRLFRTGSKVLHFKEIVATSEKTDFVLELYEGPTISNTGTEVNNKISFNRISNEDCELTIFTSPTVTADGFLLDKYYLPGGEAPGGNFSGESQSSEWEFVLKPNTDYLIKGYRITGTGTNQVLVKYRWYIQE